MNERTQRIVIDNLKLISKLLGNLNYECSGREYTLDDDAMGDVFICRDLADQALREINKD